MKTHSGQLSHGANSAILQDAGFCGSGFSRDCLGIHFAAYRG